MADELKFEDWTHTKITERDLSEQLDAMVTSDGTDRSKFVRWLIRQEYKRRTAGVHWVQVQADAPLNDIKVIDPVAKVKAVA